MHGIVRTTLVVSIALHGACASPGVPSPMEASPDAVAHRVYATEPGRFVGFDRLADRLAPADVVLFGEKHDDPGTHRMQLALLDALGERRTVVLSLEMFERDVQPVLDAYLVGKLTEEAFLAGARPWSNYATDYRPLVERAKARGWPVIAANVPRRIAGAVAQIGLEALDALPTEERVHAARANDCPRDRYFERFVEAMGEHPGAEEADPDLTMRFYEGQCVKDETMAESIAGALAEHPDAIVLHLTGAFHVEYGLGTAARVERRAPDARIEIVSAIPVEAPAAIDAEPHRARADYVLFVRAPAEASTDGRPEPGARPTPEKDRRM